MLDHRGIISACETVGSPEQQGEGEHCFQENAEASQEGKEVRMGAKEMSEIYCQPLGLLAARAGKKWQSEKKRRLKKIEKMQEEDLIHNSEGGGDRNRYPGVQELELQRLSPKWDTAMKKGTVQGREFFKKARERGLCQTKTSRAVYPAKHMPRAQNRKQDSSFSISLLSAGNCETRCNSSCPQLSVSLLRSGWLFCIQNSVSSERLGPWSRDADCNSQMIIFLFF